MIDLYIIVQLAQLRTLKCFEYKLTEEIVNHGEEIDEWLSNMDLITQA